MIAYDVIIIRRQKHFRNAHTILVGKSEGKTLHGRLSADEMTLIYKPIEQKILI
jgi:hypothetical protein